MHATMYHTNKSQSNFVREAKKIIADAAKKPEKQRQCPVCGSWIGRQDICCDETDTKDFSPVTDNAIDWEKGKELF